ncbi:S49 family peptidase [Saccharopolyspora rhizosphaerae]|uniref:S49 family peptidase n=1 Tax=Saccharopolyspora rhizosphaerae TaxID=2492662 RepID=A0A3R8Q5U1_9PSEU|nr:S49 family peptidase [Saccharopolyspora rhizosphaerae]RRO13807.1 S49 family peptidase [Saccharopolyspora rhizosphaerae]
MDEKSPRKFVDVVTTKLPKELTGRFTGKLPGVGDRKPVVAVLKLQGVITPQSSPAGRPTISIHNVESAIKRAFAFDRLSAVVLSINSPGGSPTQSALVADRIRGLAEEKGVPVVAYCEDVAASGGYWLACAADEIYAHQTSMVGSVGVVSASFGMTGLLDKLGVERRVYTAGENKVRLDPFRPVKAEDVEWLCGMQDELHGQFREWVRERRGSKLSGTEEELFSGEVWTGAKAAKLGLVDGVGTLREIVEHKFPDAQMQTVECRKTLLSRLGVAARTSRNPLANVISGLDELEHRAMWNRFGL